MGMSEAVIVTGGCSAVFTEKLCWLCLRFALDVSQDQGLNAFVFCEPARNRAVSEGSQSKTIQNNWFLFSI